MKTTLKLQIFKFCEHLERVMSNFAKNPWLSGNSF